MPPDTVILLAAMAFAAVVGGASARVRRSFRDWRKAAATVPEARRILFLETRRAIVLGAFALVFVYVITQD